MTLNSIYQLTDWNKTIMAEKVNVPSTLVEDESIFSEEFSKIVQNIPENLNWQWLSAGHIHFFHDCFV